MNRYIISEIVKAFPIIMKGKDKCMEELTCSIRKKLQVKYPNLNEKQLDEMTKITIFNLIENAKTLANKRWC